VDRRSPGAASAAEFRFYGQLNDFLPAIARQTTVRRGLDGSPSVKDAIEAIGVPHPEVALVIANGEPVSFAFHVRNGDRIAVFPPFRSIDVSIVTGQDPADAPDARFVLDGHLGRLAAYLRMCGFDTAYDNGAVDADLAQTSANERRILLTRDRGLLKRGVVVRGYLVRADRAPEQLVEVLDRFDLVPAIRPFTRCLRCNGELESADRLSVQEEVPPRVFAEQAVFRRCAGCGAIFWRGSHHRRMDRLLRSILAEASA
jgi:uncharacterized protein with PIN domain/sulfur carrier protein ThiS